MVTTGLVVLLCCWLPGLAARGEEATLLVLAVTPPKTVLPKQLTTQIFSLTNPTFSAQTYELQFIFPQGWGAILPPDKVITLQPQERRNIPLTLIPPPTAPAGKHQITLQVTAGAEPTVSLSISTSVEIKEIFTVEVKRREREKPARAGEKVKLPFRVRNRGNCLDTYQLSASSWHKWKTDLSLTSLKLKPGEEKEVTLSVSVPEKTGRAKDFVNFRASSPHSQGGARVTLNVFPLPRREFKTIYQTIPARVSLGSFSSWEELTGGQVKPRTRFWTGGPMGEDRWIDLSARTDHLFGEGSESWSLSYGSPWWDVRAGQISAHLPNLFRSVKGEGGRVHLRLNTLDLSLFQMGERKRGVDLSFQPSKETNLGLAYLEGEERIWGANLGTELGKKVKMDLSYQGKEKETRYQGSLDWQAGNCTNLTFSHQAYSAEAEKKNYGISLNQRLSSNLSLGGQTAISYQEGCEDNRWQVGPSLKLGGFSLSGSYYRTGPHFWGVTKWGTEKEEEISKDREGYQLSSTFSLTKGAQMELSWEDYQDNVEKASFPTLRTQEAGVAAHLRLEDLPPVTIGFENVRKLSHGPAPLTDQEENKVYLKLAGRWEEMYYSFYGLSGIALDRVEQTEHNIQRFRSSLGLRRGRFAARLTYHHRNQYCLEEEEEEEEEEGSGSTSLSGLISYQLIPEKVRLSLGLSSSNSSNRLTGRIDYRPWPNTTLSLRTSQQYSSVMGYEWYTYVALSQDFSFEIPLPWIPTQGRVQGQVFFDENGNRRFDQGEKGAPGVIIRAKNYEVVSNEKGNYLFSALPPGKYQLWPEDLPPGFVFPLPRPYHFEVEKGDTLELNLPLSQTGNLEGRVFNDANKDGKAGLREMGFGWVRIILEGNGLPPQRLFSDSQGQFSLSGIPVGKYQIRIDQESLPPRFIFTTTREFTREIKPEKTTTVDFGGYQRERKIIITTPEKKELIPLKVK